MFEHLKQKLELMPTAWVDFPEIADGARIQIAPASEANPGYFNAVLRKHGSERKVKRLKTMSPADFEAARHEDRDLYGKHIVIGWENLPGHNGADVPFTRTDAEDLCSARSLPNWLFDRLRIAANDPMTFLPADEQETDVEDLVKNSESGSSTN